MSNIPDDFSGHPQQSLPQIYPVADQSQQQHGQTFPVPGGFHGTPMYQGQTSLAHGQERIPSPLLQQSPQVPGVGRFPIPSGYPANALPGNVGRMRLPSQPGMVSGGVTYQSASDGVILQENSPSDLNSQSHNTTSVPQFFDPVNQFQNSNNYGDILSEQQTMIPTQYSFQGIDTFSNQSQVTQPLASQNYQLPDQQSQNFDQNTNKMQLVPNTFQAQLSNENFQNQMEFSPKRFMCPPQKPNINTSNLSIRTPIHQIQQQQICISQEGLQTTHDSQSNITNSHSHILMSSSNHPLQSSSKFEARYPNQDIRYPNPVILNNSENSTNIFPQPSVNQVMVPNESLEDTNCEIHIPESETNTMQIISTGTNKEDIGNNSITSGLETDQNLDLVSGNNMVGFNEINNIPQLSIPDAKSSYFAFTENQLPSMAANISQANTSFSMVPNDQVLSQASSVQECDTMRPQPLPRASDTPPVMTPPGLIHQSQHSRPPQQQFIMNSNTLAQARMMVPLEMQQPPLNKNKMVPQRMANPIENFQTRFMNPSEIMHPRMVVPGTQRTLNPNLPLEQRMVNPVGPINTRMLHLKAGNQVEETNPIHSLRPQVASQMITMSSSSGVTQVGVQKTMNFNSLSSSEQSSMIPMSISASNAVQPGVQILNPSSIVQTGASIPMVIAGSMHQTQQERVSVPWGWKRVSIGEQIVYFRY